MSRLPFQLENTSPEILEILASLCDGTACQNDVDRLERLVGDDAVATRLVLDYFQLHSDLYFEITGRTTSAAVLQDLDVNPHRSSWRLSLGGFVQNALNGLPENMPLACLVASLLMAVGLLAAWHIPISTFKQPPRSTQNDLAGERTPGDTAPGTLPETTKVFFVGRITGKADCQWSRGEKVAGEKPTATFDPQSPSHDQLVALGDKLLLDSGLMEITYDTGAKVILQGPCTYTVESASGGFLAIGRLTAKLEKRAGKHADSTDQSARLFFVRTPTAVVTDLGTEFGVEVAQNGRTVSHVFRGLVKVQSIAAAGETEQVAEVLHESESLQVERSKEANAPRFNISRKAVEPSRFVRSLPTSKSALPVDVQTWFRLGENDHKAVAGKLVSDKAINLKGYWHLERFGSPIYVDDVFAPRSSLAVHFSGANGECLSSSNRFPSPSDYFVLEAWVRLQQLGQGVKYICYIGRPSTNGFGLATWNNHWALALGQNGIFEGRRQCLPGKWTHLALVCERGCLRLLVNGRPDMLQKSQQLSLDKKIIPARSEYKTTIDALPIYPDGPFSIGGDLEKPNGFFAGDIDEVRLSEFIAPFRPEMLLPTPAGLSQQNDEPQQERESNLFVATMNWASGTTTALNEIRSDDLIDNHQLDKTLESVTYSGWTSNDEYKSSPDGLNDGAGGNLNVLSHANTWNAASGDWNATFTLKTDVNVAGYDIREIHSCSGWKDCRVHQKYEVFYSTVKEPERFVSLGILSDTSHENGSLMLKIGHTKGIIASGVKAIRFNFMMPTQGFDTTVYQEIDVLGKPTVMPDAAATPSSAKPSN